MITQIYYITLEYNTNGCQLYMCAESKSKKRKKKKSRVWSLSHTCVFSKCSDNLTSRSAEFHWIPRRMESIPTHARIEPVRPLKSVQKGLYHLYVPSKGKDSVLGRGRYKRYHLYVSM